MTYVRWSVSIRLIFIGFWSLVTPGWHFEKGNITESMLSYSQREAIYPSKVMTTTMCLLPDTQKCGLRMRRECRERFLRHRLQRKQSVSDPGMHHGTCVMHVSWYMAESLPHGGRKNVPGIPDACATCNYTYLTRGPCSATCHLFQNKSLWWYPYLVISICR